MAEDSGASTVLARPPIDRIAKPWGEEVILERTADTVVKTLRIAPNQRLSLQFHRRKHETLMLIDGDALLTFGTEIDRLRDKVLRTGLREEVAAGIVHRLSAGPSGANILEIASRLPDDDEDIVRLADDYGRVDHAARF